MLEEQKVRTLRIIFAGLVVLSVLLSCASLAMCYSSHKDLSRNINTIETSVIDVVNVQNQTLDKVKLNSENILTLHKKLTAIDETVTKAVKIMKEDGIGKSKELLKEIENKNTSPVDPTVTENKPVVKKSLWKRIFYVWNWFK